MPVRALKEIVGRRLRQLRKRRDWSAQELTNRLPSPFRPTRASKGGLGYKLEQGRREISDVLLLFALAAVLDVSPLVLLLPEDGDELIHLVPGRPPIRARDAYAWIIGAAPLPTNGTEFDEQSYQVARGALHKDLPYINNITTQVAGIDLASANIYRLIQRTLRKDEP